MAQGAGTTNGSAGSPSASASLTRKRKSPSQRDTANGPPSKQQKIKGDMSINNVSIEGLSLTAHKPAAGFMDLPPEILLEIFHETAFSGCPRDIINLSVTSTRMYQVYSLNKLAILRRQVSELISTSGKSHGLLVDYIIKVCHLRRAKQWPSNLEDIKRALATAADTLTPVSALPLASYARLIPWVKEIAETPATPQDVDALEQALDWTQHLWLTERHWFLLAQRVFWLPDMPTAREARHPYDCVNPRDFVIKMSPSGPLLYSHALETGLADYARHAEEPVSDRERSFSTIPGYKPCCNYKPCPRRW